MFHFKSQDNLVIPSFYVRFKITTPIKESTAQLFLVLEYFKNARLELVKTRITKEN